MDEGILLGRTQRVRVGGQLSEEVKVTLGVPQGSVLGPLMFLAYVKVIRRNIESTISLFADDCIIYRKIINNKYMENLQIDLNRLWQWAVEIAMIINPVTEPLSYSLLDIVIPEASNCKYLGIILRSDLSWANQVNYTVKKTWKALVFTMPILKREAATQNI
jgi:hypothetical protein